MNVRDIRIPTKMCTHHLKFSGEGGGEEDDEEEDEEEGEEDEEGNCFGKKGFMARRGRGG